MTYITALEKSMSNTSIDMLENNEEEWDAKYQDVSIDGRIYIIINNILE